MSKGNNTLPIFEISLVDYNNDTNLEVWLNHSKEGGGRQKASAAFRASVRELNMNSDLFKRLKYKWAPGAWMTPAAFNDEIKAVVDAVPSFSKETCREISDKEKKKSDCNLCLVCDPDCLEPLNVTFYRLRDWCYEVIDWANDMVKFWSQSPKLCGNEAGMIPKEECMENLLFACQQRDELYCAPHATLCNPPPPPFFLDPDPWRDASDVCSNARQGINTSTTTTTPVLPAAGATTADEISSIFI